MSLAEAEKPKILSGPSGETGLERAINRLFQPDQIIKDAVQNLTRRPRLSRFAKAESHASKAQRGATFIAGYMDSYPLQFKALRPDMPVARFRISSTPEDEGYLHLAIKALEQQDISGWTVNPHTSYINRNSRVSGSGYGNEGSGRQEQGIPYIQLNRVTDSLPRLSVIEGGKASSASDSISSIEKLAA